MVIDDDQRLCITINSCSTAQAHGSTGTKVTRVRHNVETGNLALQGLADILETKTFQVIHLEVLYCARILAGRDFKTCGGCQFLTFDGNLRHCLRIVLQSYLEYTLTASNLLAPCFVADESNLKCIIRIFDIHGKVTIHISNGLTDNTVILIYLFDVGTDDDINIIRYGTRDTPLLCVCG